MFFWGTRQQVENEGSIAKKKKELERSKQICISCEKDMVGKEENNHPSHNDALLSQEATTYWSQIIVVEGMFVETNSLICRVGLSSADSYPDPV